MPFFLIPNHHSGRWDPSPGREREADGNGGLSRGNCTLLPGLSPYSDGLGITPLCLELFWGWTQGKPLYPSPVLPGKHHLLTAESHKVCFILLLYPANEPLEHPHQNHRSVGLGFVECFFGSHLVLFHLFCFIHFIFLLPEKLIPLRLRRWRMGILFPAVLVLL